MEIRYRPQAGIDLGIEGNGCGQRTAPARAAQPEPVQNAGGAHHQMSAVASGTIGDDIAAREIEACREGRRHRRCVKDHDMGTKDRVPVRGRFDGGGAGIKGESRGPNGGP